jgi:DNA modification methylase
MTELVWEGKYNKDGQRVAPVRVALPFQTVETVNESAQERQEALDLFGRGGGDTDWRNRLIWGDRKYVLPALLDEFAGTVDLIYIDPPFATGADFSFSMAIPESDSSFDKTSSVIEQKAYRDTWARGLDSYYQWFSDTAVFLHQLLADDGSMYVHCDWRVNAGIRLILDELFGRDRLVNEVVWHYRTFQGQAHRYFPRKHDALLLYSKSQTFTFNEQFDTAFENTIDASRWAAYINDDHQITAGHMPSHDSRFVRYLNAWRREHKRDPEPSDVIFEVRGQPVDSVWDLKGLDPKSSEKVGYPTQKPLGLLRRIIAASSNPGDLILDCFAGSGTTPVAAEEVGRRWIAADLGRFAIHITRKRLLELTDVRPFVVQNLGKYERQLWQAAEFGEAAVARTRAYQHFILDLFKAKPLEGYVWLHGVKQGRMVHVGSVDAPVTVGDIKQIAGEFAKAVGTGRDAPTSKAVDVLGWDFAFDLNEQARQTAGRAGIDVRFWRIPREVLDKRAVEQGDIRFFELAALSVDVKAKGRKVTLALKDFVIPLDDVPEEIQRAITDWSQWIDYWAVDWNNKGDAFHNEWQTYRTKKNPKLEKTAAHEYDAAGEYQVVVKVIDILGNDTTKIVTVRAG